MKRYQLITLLLFCGIGMWADNKITISSVQGAAGTEVMVNVAMTNSDAVSALQLSIPLDGNLTFVDNSQKATARLSGHTLSAGVKDGVLNLMVYSTAMTAVSGNGGEICSFKLLLGYNPGTVSLTPSKSALTGTNGNSLPASVIAGTVETRGAKVEINKNILKFGSVGINRSASQSVMVKNVGNETLTITDVTFSSAVFSTTSKLPLTINAGSSQGINVNCTPTTLGNIDEEMTIISNGISGNNAIRLTATPFGVNELRLGNASGMTDEEVTIAVKMNNINDISGLQMEIPIPDGLEFVDGSFVLSNRKQDHTVSASLADGVLYVVAYSPTDNSFTGSEGEVGSFKMRIVGSNNVNLKIDKAKLSSTIDGKTIDVLSGKNGCTISVKSPNMNASNTIDFGSIAINGQDAQKSFSIRNRGTAPLTISNIVFANELFIIKEPLPITIEASSSKDITVICDAKEVGNISTNMELYTNDPQKRLYIVKITGNIYTPDYLMGTVEAGRTGVTLNISLSNYSDIYGIQFDINTTKDFTASADNMMLTERGKNLSLNINSISEGKLRVIAYTKNNQPISSGDGKVATIKLVPKEVLPEGDYTLTLSNILLGSESMQNVYAGTDKTINFRVSGLVAGDANKDGKVGIGDIIAIKNIMAGKVNGYDMKAADANQDSNVNNEDIISIVKYMAGY